MKTKNLLITSLVSLVILFTFTTPSFASPNAPELFARLKRSLTISKLGFHLFSTPEMKAVASAFKASGTNPDAFLADIRTLSFHNEATAQNLGNLVNRIELIEREFYSDPDHSKTLENPALSINEVRRIQELSAQYLKLKSDTAGEMSFIEAAPAPQTLLLLTTDPTMSSPNPTDEAPKDGWTVGTLTLSLYEGSRLNKSNLEGLDLRGLNPGAIKKGLHLNETLLPRADISKANWRDIYLTGVNLRKTMAVGTDFSDAVLNTVNATKIKGPGANLSGAKVINTRLEEADFRFAKLGDAFLNKVAANGANFSDLPSAQNALFEESGFVQAKFENAILEGARFEDCIATGVDLRGAKLNGVSIHKGDFSGAQFNEETQFINPQKRNPKEAVFSLVKLQGASFEDARLKGSRFEVCDLSGSDFRRTKLDGAIFTGSNLSRIKADFTTKWYGAMMDRPTLETLRIEGKKVTEATALQMGIDIGHMEENGEWKSYQDSQPTWEESQN